MWDYIVSNKITDDRTNIVYFVLMTNFISCDIFCTGHKHHNAEVFDIQKREIKPERSIRFSCEVIRIIRGMIIKVSKN